MSRATLAATATLAVACLTACPSPVRPRPTRGDLTTEAERSGWTRTGRHDEVVRLCDAFAAAYPERVRCERFGVTPERRPMVALIASGPGGLDPDDARARRRPVLLLQAGIHAGEIDGKDAALWLLRDLLDGAVAPGALDAVTVVLVPVLNVDGHERFGPNHRVNQRGPEEMGFRTTAQNLNLNRDPVKVDAPEMAALLALWRRWDPVAYVDLHTTDGAKFEHDVAVLVGPKAPRPEDAADALAPAARALSDALQARLTALGHLPLPFYPAFATDDDPASGFDDVDPPARFSHAYAPARGRLGVLVETHSWRTYGERVRATYHVLQTLLERAVTDAAGWRAAADAADRADAALAGRDVVLAWRTTSEARTVEFRGYRYERVPSDVSGALWTRYDEATPEVWRLPLRDQVEPALTVRAPRAGYLVAPAWADAVAARLDAHGLAYARLDAPVTLAAAEAFRATEVTHAAFEGRHRATVKGAWAREPVEVGAGALWVWIHQPRARLLLHLLEPLAPDSLVSWGVANAVFEQKEYMEGYVAEEVARAMLADPAVRAAFDEALRDPAFAASPERRLRWFHQRHASWDAHKDRVPWFKLDAAPVQAD